MDRFRDKAPSASSAVCRSGGCLRTSGVGRACGFNGSSPPSPSRTFASRRPTASRRCAATGQVSTASLLRYCCRIWEAERRDEPGRSELRPIVPVVLYQGARGWKHSTELADLFGEAARGLRWVPRFAHELLDQTTLEPDGVGGGLKGRIAQLLMMAAFDRHLDAALQLTARLLPLLRRGGGGVDARRQLYQYLLSTQDLDVVRRLREALRRRGSEEEGDEIMTYAQQLLAEGRAEGRAEGEARGRAEGEAKGRAEGETRKQIEMVEGLLRVGVTWEVIEAATGLDAAGFGALKARSSGTGS